MAPEEISPELIEFARQRYGASDEQIAKLSATQWRVIKSAPSRWQYRMVAEVVEANNCLAGHKKGDKYVFSASGFLLPDESTVPRLCLWAIAPMLPFMHIVYDRLAEGLDDPSPKGWDSVHCADVGLDCGGVGQVLFKVYCEKVPQA